MLDITENVVLIRINRLFDETMTQEALYEATRGVWVIGPRREKVDIAFSVYKGEVKGVYKVLSWHPAGTTSYETRPVEELKRDGRWEFTGEIANAEIRDKYLGKSVADYFSKGNSNPIKYINC
ncbi:hypothetical protein [Aliivibrio sp. SR45-2]|uniref:hypothetical protein n=1 Tax=Aliivibrio sp. SR45-2 TaxID=2760931 RepID=UPI0015FE56DB|nr:hypothetical protein [Aliivibrio sp. SR45-2]MBB1315828.1 hypothetical protein [Aliivibrio sp. SR45-2]